MRTISKRAIFPDIVHMSTPVRPLCCLSSSSLQNKKQKNCVNFHQKNYKNEKKKIKKKLLAVGFEPLFFRTLC
jgi:hypothetical protein